MIKNLCLINVHSYKSVQTYKICMINNVQFSDLTMPPSKLLTHEDCREAMCACCGIKTDKKRITVGQEALVKSYAKPEYDISVKNFPAGLCSTCRYIIVFSISSYHSFLG